MPKISKISNKIKEIQIDNPRTKNNSLKWISIANAEKKEIDYLRRKFNFNISHLRASVATVFSQRPMVEIEEKYIFVILHFPTFRGNRVVPGEIEFFIGHGFLVTLHNDNLKPLNDFFDYCKKDTESLLSYDSESSSVLLYEILSRLLRDSFNILDQNSIKINEVEDIIFEGDQKDAVNKILELRRSIINVRKIVQNHVNILEHLQCMESTLVPRESIKKHYKDLGEHSKRIWEVLALQKEMVDVLNDTNESLFNNKMNIIMKTLTIFSVLVLPLNLLAGIFGMNAKYMPFVDGPYGFWILLSIMFAGLLMLLTVFTKKRWL